MLIQISRANLNLIKTIEEATPENQEIFKRDQLQILFEDPSPRYFWTNLAHPVYVSCS